MADNVTAGPIEVSTATSPPHFHPAVMVVVGFIIIVLSAVTIFGNLLVLVAFYVDKNIRQPSNYFILSLAISDFVIGIEGFPFLTVYVLNGSWPLGWFVCDLWLSIDYTVCLASIYTVLLITVDRFCSVRIPTRYRNWRTPDRVKVMIVVVWIVPTLLFFTLIFGWPALTGSELDTERPVCVATFMQDPILNMSMYISYYWSTLVVMIVLYSGIYRAAYALEKKSRDKQRKMSVVRKLGDGLTPEPLQKIIVKGDSGANNDKAIRKSSSTVYTSDADESFQHNPKHKSGRKCYRLQSRRFFRKVHNRFTGRAVSHKETTTRESIHNDTDTQTVVPTSTLTVPAPSNYHPVLDDPAVSCSFVVTDTQIHPETISSQSPSAQDPASTPERQCEQDVPGVSTPVHLLDMPIEPELGSDISAKAQKLKYIDHDSLTRAFTSASSSSSEDDSSPDEDLLSTGTHALTDVCQEFSCISYMSVDDRQQSLHRSKKSQRHRKTSQRSGSHKTVKAKFRLRNVRSNPVAPSEVEGGTDTVMPLLQNCYNRQIVVPITSVERTDLEVAVQPRPGLIRRLLMSLSRTLFAAKKTFTCTRVSTERLRLLKPQILARRMLASDRGDDRLKSKSENRARKALRVITVILGAFVFFWTPFYVLATIYGFCDNSNKENDWRCINDDLYTFSYYLCYLNSTINPFCYALANAQFKKVFLRLLRGDLHVS